MRRSTHEADSWRRMVLHSMPTVSWLSQDAPNVDVVMSSRCRIMRNLVGHRFPHAADDAELSQVEATVLDAVRRSELPIERLRGITIAERDYLVGCRLISPDFQWQAPGRSLILDKPRMVSVMVNEEDHIRIQALTGGWDVARARAGAEAVLSALSTRLEFAHALPFGYLSASPHNCGPGRRVSSMFHLIGLAHAKRLPAVLLALAEKGLAARGLFGEASRAVGAFVQVSVVHDGFSDFVGACEYLIREERDARLQVSREMLDNRMEQTLTFARSKRAITLGDALRVLAWMRWASDAGISGAPASVRHVDSILTKLELRSMVDASEADEQRAEFLRKALGL